MGGVLSRMHGNGVSLRGEINTYSCSGERADEQRLPIGFVPMTSLPPPPGNKLRHDYDHKIYVVGHAGLVGLALVPQPAVGGL